MPGRAAKHDWHLFDVDLGLEVRQATNRFRANRWEVRNRVGRVLYLTDKEFDLLRTDTEFLLSHNPGFVP